MHMLDPNQPLTQAVSESHRNRYGRPALEKSSFSWNAQDEYAELLNFEMEVINILKKAYELTDETDEEKIPVIKNELVRKRGLTIHKDFHKKERNMQECRKTFFYRKSKS